MGENNVKDFTLNWILMGLLCFSLMFFATSFMYSNNAGGLGDADTFLNGTSNDLTTNLAQVSEDSNRALNITAGTNPEASELGSRDSVSTAFEFKKTGTGMFESMKLFFSWIIRGEAGEMLLAVFGGMLGFLVVYYGLKFIRTGS